MGNLRNSIKIKVLKNKHKEAISNKIPKPHQILFQKQSKKEKMFEKGKTKRKKKKP